MKRSPVAFTILELLIVIGIIAFLASLSLSRMPESNTRSRVSRAKSDMRAIASSLEAYRAEHHAYPPMKRLQSGPEAQGPATVLPDGFVVETMVDPFSGKSELPYYYFLGSDGWMVISAGPDKEYQIVPESMYAYGSEMSPTLVELTYDPTNGTTSRGDIWRSKLPDSESAEPY